MKQITDFLYPILRKIFSTHHPLLFDVIISWRTAVGDHYSKISTPLTIKQYREKGKKLNLLLVEVPNSSINLELSYRQDIILERLNLYVLGTIGRNQQNNLQNNELVIHKIQFVTTNNLS